MSIDLELYRIFYVVAENESITKASAELFISQPAVTKQIRKLETILGCNLFIRTKKGLILTENGRVIYSDIKNAIKSFELAEKKLKHLQKLDTGTIKIGIGTTLTRKFLLPYLRDFHNSYPNIKIEIFTDPYKESKEKLKYGKIDFIISKIPDHMDDEFECVKLGDIHECFVVNDKYFSLTNKTIAINDVSNYPLLLQTTSSNIRNYFDEYCAFNNVKFDTIIEIASSSLLIDFVKIGFGVGVVTREYVKDDLENGTLYEVNVNPCIPTKSFGIIKLKNSIDSYAVSKLLENIESLKYKM